MNRNPGASTGIALAIVSALVLSACASLAEQRGAGFIADVSPAQVRVCFHPGVSPSPGQEIAVTRTKQVGGPKAPGFRTWDIGTARVTAVDDKGCAVASVLDGHPGRYDDVRLLRDAVKPTQ